MDPLATAWQVTKKKNNNNNEERTNGRWNKNNL
jgi:hypothetical protein